MTRWFSFGGFALDLSAYVLMRADGTRVKLQKVPMELLILLVERPGALVAREVIRDALWGTDVFVEQDASINTAVRKIRRALGDDQAEPRFIETVVGKGYRFVASVDTHDRREPASGAVSHRLGATPTPPRRVFPSYSVVRNTEQFLLAEGANLLGRDPAARVYIDHSSVSRQHAQIVINTDGARLEDLGSRNGTFLNGRRVSAPEAIQDGAVIGLGPITLTFVAVSGPASTAPYPSLGQPRRTARKR
jgi:DNA-binding winged helix-turn-helix (wHTH) protein